MSNVNLANLVIALYNEHKQRTGHDIQKMPSLDASITSCRCDVCLYLGDLMKQAEKDYHPPENYSDIYNDPEDR